MTPTLTKSTPGNILGQHQVPSEMDCFDNCSKSDSCLSWSYDGTNKSCSLFDDIRMNGHKSGSYSGVKVLLVMPTLYMYMYNVMYIIIIIIARVDPDLLWYSWNAPVACDIFFL